MTPQSPTKNLFDRDYYENGLRTGASLYTDYRWIPELTIPMCQAIESHLRFEEHDTILDFGCAKGYVVKALRIMGYQAHGCDVSEYAIANADEVVKPFVTSIGPPPCRVPFPPDALPWTWILAKDVLEHLTEKEVHVTLRMFNDCAQKVFIAVPLGDGTRYIIPDMERDVTHKIRRQLSWWIDALYKAGFLEVEASFSMPGIKDRWVKESPEGNGFLIAQ